MLRSLSFRGGPDRTDFTRRFAELRSFAAKNCRAVENDRERFGLRLRARVGKVDEAHARRLPRRSLSRKQYGWTNTTFHVKLISQWLV